MKKAHLRRTIPAYLKTSTRCTKFLFFDGCLIVCFLVYTVFIYSRLLQINFRAFSTRGSIPKKSAAMNKNVLFCAYTIEIHGTSLAVSCFSSVFLKGWRQTSGGGSQVPMNEATWGQLQLGATRGRPSGAGWRQVVVGVVSFEVISSREVPNGDPEGLDLCYLGGSFWG